MTEIACPKCGTRMPYVAKLAGRQVFCLGCGLHFQIPDLRAGCRNHDRNRSQGGEPTSPSMTQQPGSSAPPSRRDAG